MADRLTINSAGAVAAPAQGLFTRQHLHERAVHRRAVEAVIWGMPAVNFDLMVQAFIDAGGEPNQIPYWSRLLDGNNQALTPNPDTIYFNPFFDTRAAGPMVLEIPPASGGSITGSIDDCWQNPLADVGPAGVDKGAGGKYLIMPPGYEGAPDGFIPVASDTWQSYAILRSNVQSESDVDVAAAVAYGQRINIYPLSQADDPPPPRFFDLAGKLYDATIRYDVRFFHSLARMVECEPWLTRDKAMIDTLRTLGIAKGRVFDPDTATQGLLESAAREAHAWLDAQYEDVFDPPFYPGTRWALPAVQQVVEGMPDFFSAPDAYPVDGRGVTYSMAYFSAKHLGAGQFYLMAIRDRLGQALDGGEAYRLRVPANAPVKLYWSATAYDRATHALIRDVPRASRASNSPGLEVNPDGSVDLWFSPEPPPGMQNNWVPTSAGNGFEVLFRFYGPEKSFFEKNWVLPDIERVTRG